MPRGGWRVFCVLYDLDALLGERRCQSVKFRFLSRVFDPRYLPGDYAREISIFHATKGFSASNICAIMLWHPGFYAKCVAPNVWLDEDIVAHADANAASITLQDGKDILIALMIGHRNHAAIRGEIPLWGTMWLQEQWRGGRKVRELADELGVAEDTVQGWKGQHGHRWL